MKLKNKLIVLSVVLLIPLSNSYKHVVIKCHRERISHQKRNVTTHVTLTCYQPVREQCNSDPTTTADGSKINMKKLKRKELRWCAVSRDLLFLFPKGKEKIVYIEGYGKYKVKDLMNRRYTHHVDILQHPSNSRLVLKKGVKITILK